MVDRGESAGQVKLAGPELTAHVGERFRKLTTRWQERGQERRNIERFTSQIVIGLLASRTGLVPEGVLQQLLQDGLPLDGDDLAELRAIAQLDWLEVEPTILGGLFERTLAGAKRSQLGAHFTDQQSIRRILDPVVLEPLQAEWDLERLKIGALLGQANLDSARTSYRRFRERLAAFRVLDPACGAGNFLYHAFVVLKEFERQVMAEGEGFGVDWGLGLPLVGSQNLLGIEVNPEAAAFARAVLSIGARQWSLRQGSELEAVSGCEPHRRHQCHLHDPWQIAVRDALLADDGSAAQWPQVDVIVGNPPFLGNKRMLCELTEPYVTTLRHAYRNKVPAGADLTAYWLEKARASIEQQRALRAGLVCTNSMRYGLNRKVVDRICETMRIFCAWSDEPWQAKDAAVRVSLLCFGTTPNAVALLDGRPVVRIFADLTGRAPTEPNIDVTAALPLPGNVRTAFIGTQKNGGFDVPGSLARHWLALPANSPGMPNSAVLKPWCNGRDITQRPSDRWIIDFGVDMSEQEAAGFEALFEYVSLRVRPVRATNRSSRLAREWWLFENRRPQWRRASARLKRYIATARHAKHRIFTWLDARVLPDSALVAIAREDDTTFGILHSRFHQVWSLGLCSWIGIGNDPRYTPSTTFETFPFPAGLEPRTPASQFCRDPRAVAIAAAARQLCELREAWLHPPELVQRLPEVVAGYPDRLVPVSETALRELQQRTLTKLYNRRPQWLTRAHETIDAAVAAAYGWPPNLTDREALQRMLELNRKRT